jgi:hypothetical protein
MSAVTTATRCAAVASLDVWVRHAWSDGLQVDHLAELDEIAVRTRNTLYRILVIAPRLGEVLVAGGHFFPDPTPARLLGCSLGGAFLKQRGIYVGFRMEIQVGFDTIVKLYAKDGEVYVLARSAGRQQKELAIRRKRLARLLRKLRAMRRSLPSRDQLLWRLGAGHPQVARGGTARWALPAPVQPDGR